MVPDGDSFLQAAVAVRGEATGEGARVCGVAADRVPAFDFGGRSRQVGEYSGYTWFSPAYQGLEDSGAQQSGGRTGKLCRPHGFFQLTNPLLGKIGGQSI